MFEHTRSWLATAVNSFATKSWWEGLYCMNKWLKCTPSIFLDHIWWKVLWCNLLLKPSVPHNWYKKSDFHKSINYNTKPRLLSLCCTYTNQVWTYCPPFFLFPPTGIHNPLWSPAHLQPPDGVWRQGTPGAPGIFPRGLATVWTALLHPEPCLHRPGWWHK